MSEQQWEYRVLCCGRAFTLPDAEAVRASAEDRHLNRNRHSARTFERRLTGGDWQPYDPEADE